MTARICDYLPTLPGLNPMDVAVAHSYTFSLYHCVFSTKQRAKLITPELQQRLWPYLGGIARDNRMKALAIGGIGGVRRSQCAI